VILLVVDSWRDDMPWNGYPRDVVPNLQRLRTRSQSYQHGYAAASFTSKSVPTLLSGQYPSSLARTSPFFTRYKESNKLLPEVLQENGVRTLGVQAHMYLQTESGLHQGFDDWLMVPNIAWDYNKDPYITAPDHTRLAIELLSKPETTNKPFFAYFHYMDPHDTYNTHKESPHWGKRPRDLYDEELFYTDLWIGKLLDFIEQQAWANNTVIIVTGDHGEAFGEHNFYRHAFELWEVLIRVPLFIYIPGQSGQIIPRWRSQVDLAPTIYDLLRIKSPEPLPGTSLLPELQGSIQPQRAVLCDLPADTLNMRHRAFIDEQGNKLIAYGQDVRYELYNLQRDPGELTDLFRKMPDQRRALVQRYKAASAAVPFVAATGAKPARPD
jgi:arylsulfatase A-like enzyme